jgi:hypothetical protein
LLTKATQPEVSLNQHQQNIANIILAVPFEQPNEAPTEPTYKTTLKARQQKWAKEALQKIKDYCKKSTDPDKVSYEETDSSFIIKKGQYVLKLSLRKGDTNWGVTCQILSDPQR